MLSVFMWGRVCIGKGLLLHVPTAGDSKSPVPTFGLLGVTNADNNKQWSSCNEATYYYLVRKWMKKRLPCCFWVPSPDGFPTHFLLPSSGSWSCLLRVVWARLILPCSSGLLLWYMEHRGAISQCQAQVVFAMQICFPGQWKSVILHCWNSSLCLEMSTGLLWYPSEGPSITNSLDSISI